MAESELMILTVYYRIVLYCIVVGSRRLMPPPALQPKASEFSGRKNPQHTFGGEVKPFVPCRRFTACKRSLNVTWKSGNFRQNSSAFTTRVSGGDAWRCK